MSQQPRELPSPAKDYVPIAIREAELRELARLVRKYPSEAKRVAEPRAGIFRINGVWC